MKKKALLQLFTFIIISFYATNNFGNSRIDSLELQLQNTTAIESRLATLSKITEEYNIDFKQLVLAARRGVDEAEKANSEKWMPVFYEQLGWGYLNTSVLDSAQILFDKALIGYKEVENQEAIASTYSKLAVLGRITNNLDKAIECELNGLGILEVLNDYKGISRAYSNLARILYQQGKAAESLKYAQQAIQIGEENDIGKELFYGYAATADAYLLMAYNESQKEEQNKNFVQNNYEKSLEIYNKAYDFSKGKGIKKTHVMFIINDQGNANKKLGRYDVALDKYNESFRIAQELKMEAFYNVLKGNIAEVYKMKGNYQKSLEIFKEAEALNLQKGNPQYLIELYRHISEVYEKLSDDENALKYYKKERELGDKALSLEKENALNELKTAFETEKKETIITTQTELISQQRWLQGISLGFVALLGMFLFQSYRNAQSRKRTNERLEKTNGLLDIKNQQNETLLKEIHHRVKNNLQTISSLLSLQSKSINDPNALDAVQESRNRVASMALIHQKLYQGENLAAIEMRDYFETIGSAILNSFGEKAKGVELDVDMSEIELDVDTAIPIGLITNELITNSLKYAFQEKEHGKISISMLKKEDNLIHLEIADNGIHKSEGISEGETGFGTMLINLLTTQLGGELEQSTTQGTATIIKFRLNNKAA